MKIHFDTVRTDAFAMDYFSFGSGARTLVILPGLSVQSVIGFAGAIAEAFKLLADDFTVYVFDRRKVLPPVYTVYDMARDAAAALRALGIEKACLFGASQGGMIALAMAIESPGLVDRLVLGAASARVGADQYRAIEGWITLAREGRREALMLAFGEAIYPPETFEQYKPLLTEAAKFITDEDLRRFVILAEGIRGFDVLDDLRKITCPSLVLGSRDDRVLGGLSSVRLAERLKGGSDCELHMYHGYGHAAYDTAPDYKERMLRFLNKEFAAKRYTGAIFDMDGVLFDTERVFQQSWWEIAAEMGVTLPDEYTEHISGTNGEVMCRVIERFYGVSDGTAIMNDCKARVRAKVSREVPVKAGVFEIIDWLRGAGLRVAVASSSARVQIESNLSLSGLRPKIDAVVSGEEVTVGKPNPEIFLTAAAAIGCKPEECFVFEDSVGGVKAGHAAGCDTIMVPDLIAPKPEIVPLCFRICESLNAALTQIKPMIKPADIRPAAD